MPVNFCPFQRGRLPMIAKIDRDLMKLVAAVEHLCQTSAIAKVVEFVFSGSRS
ncbi:MAG: hypothetical protein ABSC48_19685 [Terracidiphilus sp.]|jgi:hypothetical protein